MLPFDRTSRGQTNHLMPPLAVPLYTLHLGSRDGFPISRAEIIPPVAKRFVSFSVTEGIGFFEGKTDPGWSIRIATDDIATLVALAEDLRSTFQQFGVGIEAFGHYHRCREANRGDELIAQLWGSRHGLEPTYFQTIFLTPEKAAVWPENFAILTAYATTGEVWSDERNHEADQRLHQQFLALGLSPIRIIGSSPDRGHQEPSWAVKINRFQALTLGREFLQDAIYWVEGNQLSVISCHGHGKPVPVGTFRARLK